MMSSTSWRKGSTSALLGALLLSLRLTVVLSVDAEATNFWFNASEAMENSGISHEPQKVTWTNHCFQSCLPICNGRRAPPLTPTLYLFGWNSTADCEYRCFHSCQAETLRRGGRHWKLRGKWPHVRWYGVQEPASALFSLCNAAAHMGGGLMLLRSSRHAKALYFKDSQDLSVQQVYPHIDRLLTMSGLWSIAWLFSAAFHARDIWLTERLDYYSGNVAMAWMLFSGLCRSGWKALSLHTNWRRGPVLGSLAGILGWHMLDSWEEMKFSRNMIIMIGMMVGHTLSWLGFCFYNPRPHNFIFYIANGLIYAAAALEIFDFPPVLGSVDAHALWHAATPMLSWVFYRFLAADMMWECKASVARSQKTD